MPITKPVGWGGSDKPPARWRRSTGPRGEWAWMWYSIVHIVAAGPCVLLRRDETNLPELETIPAAKKEATEGNYGAAACLAGSESVRDTAACPGPRL